MSKYALLVGINNYPGTDSDLRGCLNDVQDLRAYLQQRGFSDANILTLMDRAATKAKMEWHLEQLMKAGGAGDELFFAYSGHGSQVPAVDPQETDRLDEILCPWDIDSHWDNPLSDNVLRRIFGLKHSRAFLTVFLDCCHSGTATRLMGDGSAGRARYLRAPIKADLLTSEELLARGCPVNRIGLKQDAEYRVSATMNHVLLAACRSDQVAADAEFGGRANGAFTWAFLRGSGRYSDPACADELHAGATLELKAARYPQRPTVEGPAQLRRRPFLGGPAREDEPCA